MDSAVLIEGLRTIVLAFSLSTSECFDTLIIERRFFDLTCLKVTLSRCLGAAIVIGSTLVKLPQIVKIILNRDAAGLSLIGVLLELFAATANGAYCFSKRFPFPAYGESVFMSLQTCVIALLILWYSGNKFAAFIFSGLYSCVVLTISQSVLIPDQVMWYGQAVNIPAVVIGKFMQVITNFRNGHTGQLSAITMFLLTLGSLVRIFTSVQDTGDPIVIVSYVTSSAVNCILTFQLLYYWNVTNLFLAQKTVSTISKKKI